MNMVMSVILYSFSAKTAKPNQKKSNDETKKQIFSQRLLLQLDADAWLCIRARTLEPRNETVHGGSGGEVGPVTIHAEIHVRAPAGAHPYGNQRLLQFWFSGPGSVMVVH